MHPQRIISLVPSQTELLHDLGLDEEVVGITKFCVHPNAWFRNKTRIGGTKAIDIEKVRSLQPTLILANKEENVKEQVDALSSFSKVYTSDISTLSHALQMILEVGELVGKANEAQILVEKIDGEFQQLSKSVAECKIKERNIKAAYFIWQNPYMVAGGDTFISDMLSRCGLNNYFSQQNRYPQVTIEEMKNCDLLLLSSEPFPFKQKHIDQMQPHLPKTKIILADGEFFSWYGSRLLKAPAYFSNLIRQL